MSWSRWERRLVFWMVRLAIVFDIWDWVRWDCSRESFRDYRDWLA